MSKIFALLKKHAIIPADAASEKLAEMEREFAQIEAEMAKSPSPAPAPSPATPSSSGSGTQGDKPAAIPPEITQRLEALEGSISKVVDAVTKISDHTSSTIEQQKQAQAAATQKRYEDHLAKLAQEGRITKAQHDEYLTPEKAKANVAALDLFVETTSQFAVNPALAQKPSPKTEAAPGSNNSSQHASPIGGARAAAEKARDDAALQEIVDAMKK